MKKLIFLIILALVGYYIYDHNVFDFKTIAESAIKDLKKEVVIPEDTDFKKELTVRYVENTEDFVPNDKQELLNIYYTVLNSGWNELTFYCPKEYEACIDDVKIISNDEDQMLSHLNSFVHPFNTYNNIYTTYYSNGKVKLTINRLYDSYVIDKIETKVNELYTKLVKPNNSARQNIKAIHDYLINNARYDVKKIDDINDNTYQSNTAYGLLFEGYAVCSGYSDAMGIFLDKLNIPNIKVANDKHVWNLVYLDNKWYHLDLTWDDPVLDSGKQILQHKFFLITNIDLMRQDRTEHNFLSKIYSEAL